MQADLDLLFSPHGPDAKVKARALLAESSRATSRLASALLALEMRIANTDEAHAEELAGMKRAFNAELDRVRDEKAKEAQRFDEEKARILEHAEHLSGALASAERSSDNAWKEASSLLEKARGEQDSLRAEVARLRRECASVGQELESERAVRLAEADHTKALLNDNNALRGEAIRTSSELERAQWAFRADLDRLNADKAAATTALSSQLVKAHELRNAEVYNLQAHLEGTYAARVTSETALQTQLRAEILERQSDQRHFNAKLDRLHDLHGSVLAVGSARGRQLLYAEALKRPQLYAQSTLTRRGDNYDFGRSDSGAT